MDFANGTMTTGSARYGLANGAVFTTFEGSQVAVSDTAMAAFNEAGEKILSGEIVPPVTQAELDAFVYPAA